jgi:hypothetical protein
MEGRESVEFAIAFVACLSQSDEGVFGEGFESSFADYGILVELTSGMGHRGCRKRRSRRRTAGS